MTELRLIHWTDSHDLTNEKAQRIKEIISHKKSLGKDESIDAVIYTGDILESQNYIKPLREGKKTPLIDILGTEYLVNVENDMVNISSDYIHEKIPEWIEEGQKSGRLTDFETLEDKQKIAILQQYAVPEIKNKYTQETRIKHFDKIDFENIEEKIKSAYQGYREAFTFNIPVLGVLGNHDFTSAYEVLGDKINFLETKNKKTLKGKSGIEFTFQGDNNSYERTLLEGLMQQYSSMQTQDEDKKQFDHLYTPKILGLSTDQNKVRHVQVDTEEYQKLLKLQESERKRLGETGKADIFLSHKIRGGYNPKKGHYGTGDIVNEYGNNSVLGGHTHGMQIGKYSTNELEEMIANATEFEIIDGEEVPVIYLDQKDLKDLNPGEQHFFVTDYNVNKQIEQIDLYEF